MNFPIDVDTPEEELAKEIAKELTIEGFDSCLALPFAIGIMAAVNDGYNDPMKGVKKLKESRKQCDEWWVKYHPDTEYGKAAKQRLEGEDTNKF